MAGRYDYGSLMADPKSFRTRTPSKQTTDEQGFLHFLGSIAPAAGSVIGGGAGLFLGGPAGAAIGGTIGNGVGQLAGGAANYGADSMTASDDEFNQKQQDRKAALMNALMAARR